MSNRDRIVDSGILTARDYSTLMQWSIKQIPKITTDLTDFTVTSPEMIFFSNADYVYDILHYILDRKFLNNQIRYSRSSMNLMFMCNLMGQEVGGYNSSETVVDFNFTRDYKKDIGTVTIPRGYKISIFDASKQRYVYLNCIRNHILQNGSNKVKFLEGELVGLKIDKDDISDTGMLVLDMNNIALNSVEIFNNNMNWVRVEDAFLVTQEAPSFSTHIYYDGSSIVKFCPGFKYMDMSDLWLTCLITNGFDGNIGNNASLVSDKIYDSNGLDVSDSIMMSVLKSSGGKNPDNIEEIRSILGSSATDVRTLVVDRDYEDAAMSVEYIYGCVVKDIGDMTKRVFFIPDENCGYYGVSIQGLKSEIYEVLQSRVPAFTTVIVEPILFRPLYISLEVFINRNVLDTSGLEKEVSDFVYDFYSRKNQKPGLEFNRTELSYKVESLSDTISYVIVLEPTADIRIDWNEIAEIKGLSIVFSRAK